MVVKYWIYILLLTLSLFVAIPDIPARATSDNSDQVWQVGDRRWNSAEERHFAEWVLHTIDEGFFLRYKIPVDCADVPYAARWIYARIAHLPAAATTTEGSLLGHWSTAWRDLPTANDWYRDQRFRQALLTMLQETSTKTLPKDVYPIAIAADSLTAGAVFVAEGHAGLIGAILLDGSTYSPVQTWEASLPRKVAKLRQRNYLSAISDKASDIGLMRFRWPIAIGGRWQYLPEKDQPYYSLEQYEPTFCHTNETFDKAVARRIDPNQYSPEKKAQLIIESLRRYCLERIELVKIGFKHCRKSNCPEGSYLWEVYSTPGRDDMIDFQIVQLQKLIDDYSLDHEKYRKLLANINLPITERRLITLEYVVENHGWLSHNPEDSIEARWGLTKCDMIRSQVKDALASLKFAEDRYRKIDPAYADLRRQRSTHELLSLREQAQAAGCETPEK